MYNKARQWPFNMTAGLQPEQLVLNYQHNLLTLKFKIKQELHDGLIEPLMSKTVWQQGMGNLRQVVLNTYIWPVLDLADDVVIMYDKEQKEICIETMFRIDVAKSSLNCRVIALVRKDYTFPSPELTYIFSEDEADSEPIGGHIKEVNNLVRLPLVGTPSSRG